MIEMIALHHSSRLKNDKTIFKFSKKQGISLNVMKKWQNICGIGWKYFYKYVSVFY